MKFTCSQCGKEHDLDDISFGADAPVQWTLITEAERSRSTLAGEQCEIESAEGRSFYIRACLQVPIRGTARFFTWGVWCSLSEKSFGEMSDAWEDPNRVRLGPYFGWLCTKIPCYPDFVFLKTMVYQEPVGTRPRVELEPTDHPLSIDQRFGIEQERLSAIVASLLHES
jgi:hypothetical protein